VTDDVEALIEQARREARADVLGILRQRFRDELLRTADERLAQPANVVYGLVGIAEGVAPIVRELMRSALGDERRLEQELRVHNDLLQEALGKGGTIPFRFGVTFETEELLRQWVAARRDELALELERLRGKSEWSVKFVRRLEAVPADGYLEHRLATAVRPDARARLALVADAVSGDAYLVADERLAEFRRAVAALDDEGYELELSGPWPAYSFARLP
jgi:hypothetical protein